MLRFWVHFPYVGIKGITSDRKKKKKKKQIQAD